MEVLLPLLGDVMTEGTITTWYQPDGADVREGEPLYQVETDKVNLTVDSPASGTLQRVVAEGETVPVGAVIARLDSVAARAPVTDASSRPESVGAAAVSDATDKHASPSARTGPMAEVEVRATPAARALARELGVDLRRLANGRRLREADVRAHAQDRQATALAGRRRVIAERMRASLAQTAQLTVSMEVDMTDALVLRDQLKQLAAEDRRPTVTDLVIRAAVLALAEHPALNATLSGGHLQVYSEIHMGIAVDADDGLIVPVVRDAQRLDLFGLVARTREVTSRARNTMLQPEEVQGGTFTVTSLGPLGVDFFTPILNPPQVAILGIGRVFPRLVLQSGRVAERQMLYLNLSFDHQAVDGAPAARFLQSLKRFLELPAALLVPTGQ
jgi:pyruvate dehydrogenase E2 component (dihydrolipoyllysine-residue acetyltransferase)